MAEVGARFTLDAMPGKQMAIDADLRPGHHQRQGGRERRRELEEESAFFGAMDGASKFVKGDAIAGIVITLVNIVGGIAIGVLAARHVARRRRRDFSSLSVGDGLVTQIPALIISLAAGMLVSKGGRAARPTGRVIASSAPIRARSTSPRLLCSSSPSFPGLPFIPFAMLGVGHGCRRLQRSPSAHRGARWHRRRARVR